MKKYLLLILMFLPFFVFADEDEDMNSSCNITVGGKVYNNILDNNYMTKTSFEKNEEVKISCDKEFSKIYIYYDVNSTTGTLNKNIKVGSNGFLHELIKLDKPLKEANIVYDDSFIISDIYIFENDIPDWVEDWQILDKADLMLMSSHADDEQLFFAGLLPKYSSEGKKIQVVYFTNHYNATRRYHEQLEGLWAVGIKYYPVVSTFPDAWADTAEQALGQIERLGYTYDDALKYQVENIRRFKPTIIVGHDEKGEYLHGQHMLNTKVLEEAYLKAADKTYDEESYKKFGTHEISKLYLHLYGENKIVLDYDTPLEYFGGRTAFQVSQDGFKKHYSQDWTWFVGWIYGNNNEITKCTQIKTYNPAYFGLYYSSVGEDTLKNDMFENIKEEIPEEKNPLKKTYKKIKKVTEKNVKKISKLDTKYLVIGGSLVVLSIIGLIIFLKKKK